mgnify:CR=1 FL=1
MSGLRQIVLMVLLVGGMGAVAAQDQDVTDALTQELVSARIQILRDAGSQEGAETTVGSYEAVLNWLGESDVHAATEKTYLQAQVDAPIQEAEIRDRMESAVYRSPDITPDSVKDLSNEELEERLTPLRLKQGESQAAKIQLDEKLATEQGSAPSIQARIKAIDNRLQELPAAPVIIEPDLQPSQFEATQWAVLAERKALGAERKSLEARLASQPARYSRRKAQSDQLELVLNGLSDEITILENELASRVEVKESDSSFDIDENTPGYGFVRQLVDSNSQLRDERVNLDKTLSLLNEENEKVENQLSSLKGRFETVKRLVSLAENSVSLGHVLMVHWHETDGFRLDEAQSVTPGTIGDHVIARTRYEDTLKTISNRKNYIREGISTEVGSDEIEPDEKLVEIAQELLSSKRELLTALIAIETELVNTSGSYDRNRTSLGDQFEEYQAYLGSRILWVPSHPTFSLEILKNIKNDFRDFLVNLDELSFARFTPMGLAALFLALLLLVLRRKIDTRLSTINKKVGRVREDSIFLTLRALALSIIRALPVPLILLLVANGLQSPNSGTAPYLAKGLEDSIAALLVLLIVRTSCLKNGVARIHFGWEKKICDTLKQLCTGLLVWWFPLIVLTAFILKLEVDSINAVLGRLVFCLDMIVLTYLLTSSVASGSQLFKARPRLRFWVMLLLVANGVFFISCAVLGYLYTSQVLFRVVTNSLLIIIAAILIFYIMQRWLLVYRRRLRFNEMLAARQSIQEGEHPETESEAVDLVSLSESVISLLKVGTITVAALSLALVWAPLFRALEVMQRVTLWTISDMADGEAIITSITLASVVQALLIGLFTIIAARNVPPLLALVLRGNKNISQGSRYAIFKLLGYSIVTVGVLAFLSTLGLRWDRLQWLVAALGVGIGFGLQEIIANFISGLIILFERPVRVGDVVTVGDCSGQVIRIRIRATTIRDFDGKELLVPNKEFVTGRLLNWTLSDSCIRMTLDVGIAYGSDVKKAISILEDIIKNHELIVNEPAPDVIFNKFDNSALNLTVRYFSTDVGQRFHLLSDLHVKIDEAFKEAGITIAFPQIDVHFDKEDKTKIIPGEAPATS